MVIIGCDFHPSYQQIALLDTETGTIEEHKRAHATEEAERFYRRLAMPALVGIEAVRNDQWFFSSCSSGCGAIPSTETMDRSTPARPA